METKNRIQNAGMRTIRKIVGIISMVLFLIIFVQSCGVDVINTVEANGEASGSFGCFLAICMLIAGIISVATNKSRGGSIVAMIFYFIGGLAGKDNIGTYSDLEIWSTISLIFAVLLLITIIFHTKKKI